MRLPITAMIGEGVWAEKTPIPIIGITITWARNQRVSPHSIPFCQGRAQTAG